MSRTSEYPATTTVVEVATSASLSSASKFGRRRRRSCRVAGEGSTAKRSFQLSVAASTRGPRLGKSFLLLVGADEAKALLPFALGQEAPLVSEEAEARGLVRVETPWEAVLRLRYAADEGDYTETLAVLERLVLEGLVSPDDPVIEALLAWVRSLMIEAGAKEEDVAKVQRLEDLGGPVVDSWFAKRLRESGRKERAEGLKEGRAEGRREGLRATLVRQARRKFGVETGKELATLLEGVSGSDRLAEVADLIIDCASGPELLARAAETS